MVFRSSKSTQDRQWENDQKKTDYGEQTTTQNTIEHEPD